MKITSVASSGGGSSSSLTREDGIDPLYIKAMRLGYDYGGLSASFLQRKLAVGFPKAGKIIDWLIENNYITPTATVDRKHQMILTRDDFEEKFGVE